MVQIPLKNLPSQELQVVLDNQNCTIFLCWRFGLMFMDLSVDDTVVFQGAICRNGADIVQFPSLSFSGSLHFWDTLGAQNPPQWDGLEDRYMLVYCSDGEDVPLALQY